MKLTGLSTKQSLALTESDAFVNIYHGAVRSGKSYVSLMRFFQHVVEGPDYNYLVCGKSERTIVTNIIDPLNKMTGNLIRYNRGMGYFTLLGKKIYAIGANDERAEGKIRGTTFAGALVDEATLIPQGFFRMLLSRLTIDGAKLFATTNPDSPFHWLKHDFIDLHENDNKFLKLFDFVIDDNPSLSADKKEELKKSYQGLWYKRFIEGQWVLAQGAVYDFFDQSLHTFEGNPHTYAKYYILGVDYGTTNPFAATLVGFNDDARPYLWVEKEYYWDSKKMGYQKTDFEYAQDLQREFGGYTVQIIYLDPSAESFQVELRRQRKPVKQAKNEVLDGIRSVANFFSNGDLVISKNCINLIKEIEGYVWDEKSIKDGVDRPVKTRDHALDAMRYAIHSHWGGKSTLKEATREQSYQQSQEKLWSKNPMTYPGFTNSFGWQRY